MRRPYTFTKSSGRTTKKRQAKKFYLLIALFLLFDIFYFFNYYHPRQNAATTKFDYTTYQKEASAALNADKTTSTIPLLLQNNPQWAETAYGTGDSPNTVAEKGCAIVSLAMITSFWENKTILPATILEWAGNTYYVPGQGTSWQIFSDYATAKGWHFANLSSNWDQAAEKLAQGIPLIVSIKPGTFITSGHIMVITQGGNGEVKVYDPNDNPDKRHAFQTYSATTFANEAANYWALYR